ncbi:LuxR C-terminal-related transcriptional regulator [Streptomyces sp. G45]|uniref:LuxR C-terminal-related transcriptional regulator n=1 Tax=Streptomyces sp. G45 TaxID=3406627 RepID=UPI003C26BA05
MIRVLLVHDARLLRSALAERLARESDLEVFHTPWATARHRLGALRPDLCVADLDCEPGRALAPLGDLRGAGNGAGARVPLLVLVSAHRPGQLRRATDAGAVGFVDKASAPEQLLTAIRQVASGARYVDDSLGFCFLKAAQMPLTERELSVLSLTAAGASVSEVAHRLHLTNGTVRNYLAAITRKTGARNKVDAVLISQGQGWV